MILSKRILKDTNMNTNQKNIKNAKYKYKGNSSSMIIATFVLAVLTVGAVFTFSEPSTSSSSEVAVKAVRVAAMTRTMKIKSHR